MIRSVIFDMDGTVLDTLTTITYYVNETFQKHGISPITPEECRYFVGNGAKALIQRALASKGIADAEIFACVFTDYNAAYNRNPTHLTAPFPGVSDMIKRLRKEGIRIGIVSNKPHSATAPLAETFFGRLVDMTCGGREGFPLKPDPTVPQMMAKAFGVLCRETVYVGDSGVDMQTGKNMNAALTVGVTWGFRPEEELIANGCDVLAHTPEELTEIILSKNESEKKR